MSKRILENIESVFEEAKILENVFENSTQPKIIMDDSMNIYTANKAARILFQIEDLTKSKQRNLKKCLSKKAINSFEIVVNQVRQKNEHEVVTSSMEVIINSKNYYFDLMIHPHISNDWHFWIFNDVTKKINEQESRNQFIAIAGHEIRTPLSVVIAYAELLKRKYKSDKTALKYISKIEQKTEVLGNYIESIIDEIKIGAGKLQFNDSKINIHNLIENVIEDVSKTFPKRKISYVNDEKKLTVIADENRLEQVLQNLLINAIKYSSSRKEILVSVAKSKNSVIISVKDYGVGIRLKDQKKIFRAFYRNDTSKQRTDGLGLGLYISSQILARYGSRLQVNSRRGKGATFYFELPIN